jgi:hypothetical protein
MPPRVPNLPRKPFNFIVFDHAEKSGGNAFKSRRGRLIPRGGFRRSLQPFSAQAKKQAKPAAVTGAWELPLRVCGAIQGSQRWR